MLQGDNTAHSTKKLNGLIKDLTKKKYFSYLKTELVIKKEMSTHQPILVYYKFLL